jgi:formate hydrogenlyase subunit 6/NADH:ubiquinone oxidoreductase subunit I
MKTQSNLPQFEEQMGEGGLATLIQLLQDSGIEVVGPQVRDQAIVYDVLKKVEDLPRGYTEKQERGFYRLAQRDDRAYFGFTVGPDSWKKFLFVPKERLWKSHKNKDGKLCFTPEKIACSRRAFLGVRACELAAIRIQDQIFLEGPAVDRPYQERRATTILIAVQCMSVAPTCFCASMKTGPGISEGFDLLLVEVPEVDNHRFLLKSGSPEGEKLMEELRRMKCLYPTSIEDSLISSQQVAMVADAQVRSMKPVEDKKLLDRSFHSVRWDEISKKCLNCANCTLVCPTCFCSRVEDTTDLKGDHAERWRKWDSCFSLDHSYIHGGSVRQSGKSRYRQWLTHKVSSWFDQYGKSGCVGCGRCISWCPVGIDLTEEIRAFDDEKDFGPIK